MKKKNRRIFIWSVLALLVVVLFFIPKPKKIGVETPEHATSTLQVVAASTTEKGNSPPYAIDVEYPRLAGLADNGVEKKVNAAIKASVDASVADFKNNVSTPPAGLADAKSTLTVRYDVAYVSPYILSFALNGSDYSAGAAHPTDYVDTMTFDLRTGNQVTLADLFKEQSDYLQTISAYAIPALTAKLNIKPDDQEALDWVQSGASPKSDNYRDFLIGKEGLIIVFNPYQVAPYVVGSPQIAVPYALLERLMDPAGLLGVRLAQ